MGRNLLAGMDGQQSTGRNLLADPASGFKQTISTYARPLIEGLTGAGGTIVGSGIGPWWCRLCDWG